MASLYEIDQRLLNLQMYGVDSDTGEVATSPEDFQRMFDEINMDAETKFINTACFIKNLRSDAAQFKAEEDRLKARRMAKENLADRLENAMDTFIKHRLYDIDDTEDFEKIHQWKIDKPQAKITYRPSTKLEIDNEKVIPKEYKTVVKTVNIDKKGITQDIKNGVNVKGVHLATNLNIQIR